MSALSTLRHQAWMDYGTSDKGDKKTAILMAASAPLPVPLWWGFAEIGIDLPPGIAVTWGIIASLATLWSFLPLAALPYFEYESRSVVKKAVKEHVDDALDAKNSGCNITLTDRLQEHSKSHHHWGSLSPRHLRWIEHVHQTTLKREVEARAEAKRIANDHYGSFAAINRIGDNDSRAMRETKSFLDALDDIYKKDRLVLENPKKKEFAEFDEKMKEALSA